FHDRRSYCAAIRHHGDDRLCAWRRSRAPGQGRVPTPGHSYAGRRADVRRRRAYCLSACKRARCPCCIENRTGGGSVTMNTVRSGATGEMLVELRNIAKHYGEGEARVDALKDISLSVTPGSVVGLLGPSGSGKSTLLNVIGCIVEPSGGWMMLDGEVVYDNRWLRGDLRRLRLEKIGFIFQSHNLLPFLTVTENVEVVLDL